MTVGFELLKVSLAQRVPSPQITPKLAKTNQNSLKLSKTRQNSPKARHTFARHVLVYTSPKTYWLAQVGIGYGGNCQKKVDRVLCMEGPFMLIHETNIIIVSWGPGGWVHVNNNSNDDADDYHRIKHACDVM